MSRAFVKETDEGAPPPERAPSPHPNYVTRRGLRLLEEAAAALAAERETLLAAGDEPAAAERRAVVERDLRYLAQRIASAIPVAPDTVPPGRVAVGRRVMLAEPDGRERTVTIVGEDEADAGAGLVSWVSPLGRALADAETGDLVTWKRPAGDIELEILSVEPDPREAA
jgi:transcription elongation GreA/GreB family factor